MGFLRCGASAESHTSQIGRNIRCLQLRIMDNRLKSLRTLHNVIIVASSIVLLFAMLPDRSVQYQAALQEINALRRVKLADYPDYVKQQFRNQNEANYQLLLRAVHSLGIGISGHPYFSYPVVCNLPPIQPGLRLVDYEAFLRGSHRAGVIVITSSPNLVAGRLRKVTADLKMRASLVGLRLAPQVQGQGYWSGNTRLYPWGLLESHGSDLTEVQFYLSDSAGTNLGVRPIPVTFTIGPVKAGQLALDWLRSTGAGRRLFGKDLATFLPSLRPFWGRVGTMTLDNATAFLEQQIESTTRGSLSFFGISVERSLVIWVGPALSLFVVVFFVLHLGHFLSISRTKPSESDQAAEYPWIISFPGRISGALGYVTLFVLPLAANVLLILRHGRWQDLSTKIGAGLIVFVLASCFAGALKVRRYRSEILNGSM